MTWYDDYLATFNTADVNATLKFFSPDIVYTDFSLGKTWKGHDAMPDFILGAKKVASDMTFAPIKFVQNDRQFASEWLMTGTNDGNAGPLPPTNKPFRIQGATYGLLDAKGRILQNSDYWNMLDFLVQIGVMPPRPV